MDETTTDLQSAARPRKKKIIIFYSSIGNGHVSAARTIRKEILRRSPDAVVILKDIRTFMNAAWRALDERLYWFVATNLPNSFDALFNSFQHRGSRVVSLASLPCNYSEERVTAYLRREAPDAILATHYGAAQLMGTLRERGLLTKTRTGWLHTDFFGGYFPRISKRIDRTFLAHADLEAHWVDAGVPPDKVITSGMPVDVPNANRQKLRRRFADHGLLPEVETVLITTGREGVGDHSVMIRSLVAAGTAPLQILVVCGTNAARQSQLSALAGALPPRVTLRALGLVPHSELMKLMGAADLLITKPGGLTPSEAFALGTPTVLLDVVGGHERENAAMFCRTGLAMLAPSPQAVGGIARRLLNDRAAIAAMMAAQRAYRRNLRTSEIVGFALDDRFAPTGLPDDFGAENGAPVADAGEVLARLDHEAPADIELLLSYSTAQSPQRIVRKNPFGHIAIRIGPTVYSANHIAEPDRDPKFLQHIHLADYLYGIDRPSLSQVHTNTYGMAYGRETLGLRVAAVPPAKMKAMRDAVLEIEEHYRRGLLRWNRSTFNCADVVVRILAAGGWPCRTLGNRLLGLPSMPLDIFEEARAAFSADTALRINMVAYRKVPGARANYRFSRFPLSLAQPLRSLGNVLREQAPDPLERLVNRQLCVPCGERRLLVDVLWVPAPASADGGDRERTIEQAFVADLQRLIRRRLIGPLQTAEPKDAAKLRTELHTLMRGVQRLLHRASGQMGRLRTPATRGLREFCDGLLSFYLRSSAADMETRFFDRALARLCLKERFSQALASAEARARRTRAWVTTLFRRDD